MATNNKISNLISSQVPFFVRNDHPNFVRFMETYYEYLEQQNKELDYIKNLQAYDDIDRTIDVFADKFYLEYLKFVPNNVQVDKAFILKHIKDFYRSRGTQNSIEFLLRILFNLDSKYYYPKRDILKVSDGKWLIEKSIRVRDVRINNTLTNDIDDILKFTSRNISGNTSNAKAIVETVDVYYEKGSAVYELKVSNQIKDFSSGEIVFTTIEEDGVTKTLTANLFSGIVSSVTLSDGGTGYTLGDDVPLESNTGSGATITISSVSRGNLKSIVVQYGGAGYQNNDNVLVSGGGGSGATANVIVIPNGLHHPNSYNIIISTISLEANTQIGNTIYSNLNSSNANSTIANSVNSFVYGNCGPIFRSILINPGSDYITIPTLDVESNTRVRALGILGRMRIVDGGLNYSVGDTITFTNVIGGYGTAAAANVTGVEANGKITSVYFVPVAGHIIGGSGYTQDKLPTATVVSGTGNGANVVVTAILGDGEILTPVVDEIGRILSLSITSGGSGYLTAPVINLTSLGDGTAKANATVITGVYTYPGRFINDDGHISSFNFLEDRDYYQNYSYVVKIGASLNNYQKAIANLIHPGGMKLFAEYTKEDENIPTIIDLIDTDGTAKLKFANSNYYFIGSANTSNVRFNINSHGLLANSNVYIDFLTSSSRNVSDVNVISSGQNYSNGYITISSASGTGANARITTNATGSITDVIIENAGSGYSDSAAVTANAYNLITYNISSVGITNAGRGYSNGYITFTGGSGRLANANLSVNSTGGIVAVTINNRGTGYANGDTITIDVSNLLSYNVANANVVSGGSGYSNGFATFIGGSGYGANANVVVGIGGVIQRVNILNNGNGYKYADLNVLELSVAHLVSYNIANVLLIGSGKDFSNGFISFEGGTGSAANANIRVDQYGAITTITLNNRGTGYGFDNVVVANVTSLLTYNIANISISNAGRDYSNGYISFEGGTGRLANGSISVNASGSIVFANLESDGTGYTFGDTVTANVRPLLTSNLSTITISTAGNHYSNGYLTISGDTGTGANASVSVNSNGVIDLITINDSGTAYSNAGNITVKATHLLTTNIKNLSITSAGSGYTNGFINIIDGSVLGKNANATISVNASGSIVFANLNFGGTGFLWTETLSANLVARGGNNAVVIPNLNTYNDNAVLTPAIQKGAAGASIPVTIQRGTANSATLNVALQITGNLANIEVDLQRGVGGANLTSTLQRGAGNSNLVITLQSEPLSVSDGIYRVVAANTNWFYVTYPNTSNVFGVASAGIFI